MVTDERLVPLASDMKIPKWAEKAAFEAQTAAIEECKAQHLGANYDYPFVTGRSKEVLDLHIARALLAAEQMGRKAGLEEAAKVAEAYRHGESMFRENEPDKTVYGWGKARRDITAAIRSLGEKI